MDYEITDFQSDIIDASMEQPVVVDFWAEWCQPCKTLGPILEKMAVAAAGRWKLVKVDVEANQALAQSFQVQSIPQVYLVSEGKLVDGFEGVLPEEQVAAWLDPLLASIVPVEEPESGDLERVRALLEAGEDKKAGAMLAPLLAQEPENEEAVVLMVRTKIFQAPTEAVTLLERIKIDSKLRDGSDKLLMLAQALLESEEDLPAHKHVRDYYAAALIALRAKKLEEALEQYLDVLYRDKTYYEGGARKGILGIFEFLGREHALTKGYHRRFEMAMF